MRLGILASHAYPNQVQVSTYIFGLDPDQVELVVTGGCSGGTAGLIVETCAALGIPVDWSHMDNQGVVNDSDFLVMFWDGVEQEPFGVIEMAVRVHKPTLVYYPDGKEERVA